MRTFLLTAAAALFLARAAAADGIAWIKDDYDKALAEAKSSGKLLHANFWAEW